MDEVTADKTNIVKNSLSGTPSTMFASSEKYSKYSCQVAIFVKLGKISLALKLEATASAATGVVFSVFLNIYLSFSSPPFSVRVYSFLFPSDSFLIGLSGANRVFSEIAQKIFYAFKILQKNRTQSAKTKTGLSLKISRYQRQK